MFRPLRRPLVLCAFWTLFWAVPAWANTVVVAKRIDLPGVSLQDVRAQLAPGAQPDTLQVSLHAGKADIPELGWRKVDVTLSGVLRRDRQMRWMFEGATQLNGAPGGALANAVVDLMLDGSANTLEINADEGATHIGTALPLDQPTHAQINLRNLPAGWLQGLLGAVWPGRIAGGKLDADLALDLGESGFQSSGDVTVADLAYATPSGHVAGQGVSGHARFALDATAHPAQFALNGVLHGGELQLGSMLAKFPTHEVVLDLGASTEQGGLDINRLHVEDADALQLDGALAIDAKGNVQKLRLDHFQARFPAAYDRYGQPWLDNTVAPHLQIAGGLDGHLDYIADTWRNFAFHTNGLDIADSGGVPQVSGLRGGLDWSAQGDSSPTTLSWRQLVRRQFVVGAAQSRWRSHEGTLSLQSPLDLPILKGQARITTLNWRPAATNAERFNLAASVAGIDMAAVNQALGWTPFQGTLDGSITSTRWTGDRYALEGALTIKAFDGTAVLDHLSVQQPLSNNPVLTGNIALHQLDLAPLADAFNVGGMTGRLDGSIDDLQLVNGSPVTFKASLLAQNGGHISLRAANSLSIITGGTAASGLQGAVMKLFKTLSYKRMGIHASLQNGVCTLSGLDTDDSDSYLIVEGSGLPYLHVIGAQNRIEWPVLEHRLKVVSQGAVAER